MPQSKERAKEWKKANPEKVAAYSRKYLLKRKYSIELNPEKFQEMYDAQGGKCAICQKEPLDNHLSVDHNHETGEIRGLLCVGCNWALGWVKEDVVTLLRMIDYINGIIGK